MSINKPILKIVLALALALVSGTAAVWALPALADGTVKLSPLAVGAPDIEVNSDGSLVALAYYKKPTIGSGGGVYLKSADAVYGWRTRAGALGLTNNQAPALTFSNTVTSTVYVTWIDYEGSQVRYARCNLSPLQKPSCPDIGVVYNSSQALSDVDIAIDGNGKIHMAWSAENLLENKNSIQTVVFNSIADLPLTSVTTHDQRTLPEKVYRPRLAAAGGRVHLVYLYDNDQNVARIAGGNVLDPWEIRYVHSTATPHSWMGNQTFAIGGAIIQGSMLQLEQPVVAASGTKVHLALEAATNLLLGGAVLIGIESTTSGDSWGIPKYITSTQNAGAVGPNNGPLRQSRINGSPLEENGLRPRITISGTGYAIVWQQLPVSSGCSVSEEGDVTNSSSEIYGAYTSTTWLGAGFVTENSLGDYAIAPDVAVAPDGVDHVAYMRYNGSNCANGDATEYAIYYTGPFTETINDQGESGGGPFLPIITKNAS